MSNGNDQKQANLLEKIVELLSEQKKKTDELSKSKELLHQAANLTDREVEILKLIAQGLTNKEIGEKLFISHRTVDTHRTNLQKKLNVKNIAGLIRFTYESGIMNK